MIRLAVFFRDVDRFRVMIEKCADAEFLQNICLKYHYAQEEIPILQKAAERMRSSMLEEAAFEYHILPEKGVCLPDSESKKKMGQELQEKAEQEKAQEKIAEAVITLGSGVDILQEEYTKQGLLSESYMVEVLGSEVLLQSYGAYNQWVADHTDFHVARYFFLGSEEAGDTFCSLHKLPEILGHMGLTVTCNESYCMLPRKSVAFYALLTKDSEVQCQGICVGCGSRDCPNRISRAVLRRLPADMTDRPLTYGYARILGKEFL